MKILLTNDDGYFSPGITALFETLSQNHEVTIIAPSQERSTTGHALSLSSPLRLNKVKENVYACSGYPADCSYLALSHYFLAHPPDLVIAGINNGANLGQDVYYSGTVAAAREACFHGVKALSISLAGANQNSQDYYFEASYFVKKLVELGIGSILPKLGVLNINYPNRAKSEIKGVKRTEFVFEPYISDVSQRVDTRGRNYYWLADAQRKPDNSSTGDAQAVREGYISLNWISMIQNQTQKFEVLDEFIQEHFTP